MLTDYIKAAMRHATYEILDDGTYYGEIPGVEGVFSNAQTLEETRDLLQSVLEGWLLLSFDRHLPIPIVDGIDLSVKRDVA
jgi:predicted RNase H-like HicB family nuclease